MAIGVVAVLALGVLAAALVKLAGDSSPAPAPRTTIVTGAQPPAARTPTAPTTSLPGAATTPTTVLPGAAGARTTTTTAPSTTTTTPGAINQGSQPKRTRKGSLSK